MSERGGDDEPGKRIDSDSDIDDRELTEDAEHVRVRCLSVASEALCWTDSSCCFHGFRIVHRSESANGQAETTRR